MKLSRQSKSAWTPAGVWDFCVRWLGIIHTKTGAGFLFVFRKLGKALGILPWGPRFSLAFVIAALLILWFSVNSSSLFLVKGLFSLEPFSIRNSNKISFRDADFSTALTVTFIRPDAEKSRLFEALNKEIANAPEGEAPSPKQLALAEEITGIDSGFLEGALQLKAVESPEKIIIQISTEKTDGSTDSFEREIENPAPRQLELVKILSASGPFDSRRTPELEELLPGENPRKIDFREITALKFVHAPAQKQLLADLQPLDQESLEKIEEKFELDNTVSTFPPGQYKAFRNAAAGTVVDRELEIMNEHLRDLAKREEELQRSELRKKAEEDIRIYKASHGKITEADKKAIFERYRAMERKVEPLVLEKSRLKQSRISEWYLKAFRMAQFNPDNLQFEPYILLKIYDNNLEKPLENYTRWGYAAAAFLLLCALAGILSLLPFLRKPAYYLMLSGGILFALYWCFLIFPAFHMPDSLMELVSKKEIFSSEMRNKVRFDYLWLWLPGAVYSFFLWFPLLLSSAKRYFQIPLRRRELGDVLADNLRCRGANPGLFRSAYWVSAYYFVILMLLPTLLHSCYREDEYSIPKGDGGGQIQVQQMKRKKPKKRKRRYVLNPNSAFIFTIPELPDEELLQEIDEASAQTYSATAAFGSGKKSGGKPGWPSGMENGVIRFIRLKYSGGDWDQDMGRHSDYNMLLKLQEWHGFRIAGDTEAISIDELEKRFRNRKKKPPFVYITGKGGINLSSREVKQLRDYLLRDGGLLFGDNGGGYFDRSFRAMLKRVLPNHTLVDIANDDVIYQLPYYFPDGAPRLWHHSGNRALGIKNNGRWIVFYHQGDINDAWKTGGSGASRQVQLMAFRMGANVIAYAFSRYLEHVYGEELQ